MWHDRSGQFRVEAAFLGFANGKIRLHKVNGVVIEVPSRGVPTGVHGGDCGSCDNPKPRNEINCGPARRFRRLEAGTGDGELALPQPAITTAASANINIAAGPAVLDIACARILIATLQSDPSNASRPDAEAT